MKGIGVLGCFSAIFVEGTLLKPIRKTGKFRSDSILEISHEKLKTTTCCFFPPNTAIFVVCNTPGFHEISLVYKNIMKHLSRCVDVFDVSDDYVLLFV